MRTWRRRRDVADRALDERYPVRQIVANLLDGPTTVETAVEAWLASEEHRRNLLLGAYRDVGLGVAVGENPSGKVTVKWVLYPARPRA
ncbi:MAG TPA: CAP domain-containing protein [Thermoanaerobaculia bacterium]|nr:CAP domain-containing protein [Thermoanaerobaculia bacterium]